MAAGARIMYCLPLKVLHEKFVISFILFKKGYNLSWYVVRISAARFFQLYEVELDE